MEPDSAIFDIIGLGTGEIQINAASGSVGGTGWHYIAITKIDYDVSTDKYTLTCSSWGNEYTFDLDDFYVNSGWTGGIVKVEK